MATFKFRPTYAPSQASAPRIRKSQFAEPGYEHRLRFGLNTNPKTWSIQFENHTDAERDQILAFFDERGGVEAFDWDFTLTARRNRLIYTEDYSQSIWVRTNITSIASEVEGYLGGNNAYGIVPNTTNGFHVIQQTAAVPANTNTTGSVFVKQGIGRDVVFSVYGTTLAHGVTLNFGTGSATPFTDVGATTTDWGAMRVGSAGWWRLYVTGRPDNGTVRALRITTTNASGGTSYAGDAASSYVFHMGPQIEYGGLTEYQPILTNAPAEKWVCEQWDWNHKSCNNNSITATFRQVYEA